ncbi:MAG TPA: hypothetical protein VMW04_02515 [Patescibacteria group bacterium]|nr:hypothetical protein [Patescibacteria group bacterium]
MSNIASAKAFGRFATSIIPQKATDQEKIEVIQKAAKRYNSAAEPEKQISLLYHFTDTQGAQAIKETQIIGRRGARLYLTPVSPKMAQPLCSPENARGYEKYFRDKVMPANLKEHLERFVLGLKFKWEYGIQMKARQKKGEAVIPVGAHKLENVFALATKVNNPSLKRDQQGEIYIEKPVKTGTGSEFSVFGPYRPVTPGRYKAR